MKNKLAMITGVGGQDGQFMSKILLEQGYEVIGTSHQPLEQKRHLNPSIRLEKLNLEDNDQINHLVNHYQPSELYCLAGRASSADLHSDPVSTTLINGVSCLRFLEAVRQYSPSTRLCFASSSEVFAGGVVFPQSESTAHAPVNPYGIAKSMGMQCVKLYRQQYDLFACSAVLYNHESHLRSEHFVSKKICKAAARISQGLQENIQLGDLNARRDWGFAEDTVRAMMLMLQSENPDDFVVATGILHDVATMCKIAFDRVGLKYEKYVISSPQLQRRTERVAMVGDSCKAKKQLGWSPSVSFMSMIETMVDFELRAITTV